MNTLLENVTRTLSNITAQFSLTLLTWRTYISIVFISLPQFYSFGKREAGDFKLLQSQGRRRTENTSLNIKRNLHRGESMIYRDYFSKMRKHWNPLQYFHNRFYIIQDNVLYFSR